jgi:hypothetical protein
MRIRRFVALGTATLLAAGSGLVVFDASPVVAGDASCNETNGAQCPSVGVGVPGRTVPIDVRGQVRGGNYVPDPCVYVLWAEENPNNPGDPVYPPRPSEAAVAWIRYCPDYDFEQYDTLWFEPGEGPPEPLTAAEVLAPLWAEVQGRLELPQIELDPPASARSIIHLPTFVAITNPQPATRYTATVDPITVWIDVFPNVALNPGEPGAAAVPCDEDGSDFVGGDPRAEAEGACAHIYEQQSTGAGWPGNVTITWQVTWDSNVPTQEGTLAAAPSTNGFQRIVDEVQTVVVGEG